MKENINIYLIPALIIALGFIASTAIGSFTFYKIRALADNLSVTGSAKKQITSDRVKWTASISRTVKISNLKAGYSQLGEDLLAVNNFFKKNGIAETELDVLPVSMYEVYKQNENAEKEYTLTQNIELNYSDVAKISTLSKNANELINQGIIFSTVSLDYSYSKLADLRVSLLAEAIRDAKARASVIAETSGKKIGQLKSAASGVVQVMAINSTDVSDYGSYNTGNIEKDVMVTVKASFSLE